MLCSLIGARRCTIHDGTGLIDACAGVLRCLCHAANGRRGRCAPSALIRYWRFVALGYRPADPNSRVCAEAARDLLTCLLRSGHVRTVAHEDHEQHDRCALPMDMRLLFLASIVPQEGARPSQRLWRPIWGTVGGEWLRFAQMPMRVDRRCMRLRRLEASRAAVFCCSRQMVLLCCVVNFMMELCFVRVDTFDIVPDWQMLSI